MWLILLFHCLAKVCNCSFAPQGARMFCNFASSIFFCPACIFVMDGFSMSVLPWCQTCIAFWCLFSSLEGSDVCGSCFRLVFSWIGWFLVNVTELKALWRGRWWLTWPCLELFWSSSFCWCQEESFSSPPLNYTESWALGCDFFFFFVGAQLLMLLLGSELQVWFLGVWLSLK